MKTIFNGLDAYLARPEPAFRWEKKSEKRVGELLIEELRLTSQTWQGNVWEHRVQVCRPDKPCYPDFCVVRNTGGNGGERDEAMSIQLARDSGCTVATMFNNPMQPLYGGLYEDALIAYTWQKYLETNDESWPLHFPMAKAVLKTMDALQQHTKNKLQRFMVFGASKRGWTTWLVGASQDKRVVGIAPQVIDVLKVAQQISHQLDMLGGKPSEEIEDYVRTGFDKLLLTPPGKRLMDLEDPYSYRERLTLPKLLQLGTNDRYWAQDALNLYWDGLLGPKWVLYAPNSGHGLEDRGRVMSTLAAFTRSLASRKPLPKLTWSWSAEDNGARLRFTSTAPIRAARLFRCLGPTTDFRDQKWSFTELPISSHGFDAWQPNPRRGFAAAYGEATFDLDGQPLHSLDPNSYLWKIKSGVDNKSNQIAH